MAGAETIHVLTEGGVVYEMDLPLPEAIADRLGKGLITRVNEDGTPFEEKPEKAKPASKAKDDESEADEDQAEEKPTPRGRAKRT